MNLNEWTTKMRYQPYQMWDKEYLTSLESMVQQSSWKLDYHIQPTSGLLNDPNGFAYFNGQWHLFYQCYPYGPVHGLKSWYHLTSDNLVDWKNEGVKLEPSNAYDSHGVYSGTALPMGDQLFLAYTGNVRDENWNRFAFQMGAMMNQDKQVTKIETPLLPNHPTGYTDHFRDPQVIPYGDGYLMVIGAQTEKEEGKVLIYQGRTLFDWQLLGELDYLAASAGFMVECPNLVFIDERPVLIFCPQGIAKETLDYQNIFPNAFVIGDRFNLDTLTIENPQPIQNLDAGFDLYASQVMQAPDGRVLSVGWAGLPELTYPTDAENWAHCLSLVKELTIKDNQLYQTPVAELTSLRQEQTTLAGTLTAIKPLVPTNTINRYELQLHLDENCQGQLHLFADAQNQQGFTLHFDGINGKMSIDRSRVSHRLNEDFGTTRSLSLEPKQAIDLQIFVDQSICEIFVNGGQHVLTSRVFPSEGETQLLIEGHSGTYRGSHWQLRSSFTQ
ncbi:sucrose-6-phosphate hydrolase [Enterococcus sp. LJL98]